MAQAQTSQSVILEAPYLLVGKVRIIGVEEGELKKWDSTKKIYFDLLVPLKEWATEDNTRYSAYYYERSVWDKNGNISTERGIAIQAYKRREIDEVREEETYELKLAPFGEDLKANFVELK